VSSKQPSLGTAIFWFVMVATVGLAADLISKTVVFAAYWPYYQHPNTWQPSSEPHWLIDGMLGFQTSTNGGALFGMMQGYQSVFIVLSLMALLAVVSWLFLYGAWRDRILLLCLAMITAGILGNLYDRMGLWHELRTPEVYHYQVRDWIHFRIQGVPFFDPWPNFNIADALLVCGVGVMMVQNLFFAPIPPEQVDAPANASDGDAN